jgi:hypothetical protein
MASLKESNSITDLHLARLRSIGRCNLSTYLLVFFSLCGLISTAQAQKRVKHEPVAKTVYAIPRPVFDGLHVGMSQDSAFMIMRSIALRRDTLHVDSTLILESDSVRVFGQPAYLQLQIVHKKIRTIVINYHPLGGFAYVNLRDVVTQYIERLMGRGVVTTEETLTHHRWETEDGTTEVSHSDKYTRMFIRLGKPRV